MRPALVALLLMPALAHAGFRASSHKSVRGNTEFSARAALDGDPATAWQTDPMADNVGSWFEIDVPRSEIDTLDVRIGWERDEESFSDYARIRTLKVEIFDQAAADSRIPVLEQSVTFEDRSGWQQVDLPNTAVGDDVHGGRVRLTVVEVFDGKDYPNMAVSEVLLRLVEIECPISLDTPPDSAHEDHFPGDMVDGDARTFWSSGPSGTGRSFRVAASGYGASRIGIQPGPATHNRPKTVEITANRITRRVELPEDARSMQWFDVPPLSGYTGSGRARIDVTVVDTWPGSRVDELAIAEVQLKATTFGGL